MIGLMLSISAYGFSFILTQSTDFCIVDGVLDSINKTKLQDCISRTSNHSMTTYYVGFVGIIMLAVSTILLSPLSFKLRP